MTLPYVKIYTDGSARTGSGKLDNGGTGGKSGYAAILLFDDDTEKVIVGGFAESTSSRCEWWAIIKALETLETPHRIDLFTDFRVVQKITKESRDQKSWKVRYAGKIKGDSDLINLAACYASYHNVRFHYIAAHGGVQGNEHADDLAGEELHKEQTCRDVGFEIRKCRGELFDESGKEIK